MAALEFVLSLIVLLPLVLGTIDLGLAYKFKVLLNNAANAGAAFAQNHPNSVDATGNCAAQGTTANSISDAIKFEQGGVTTIPNYQLTVTNQSTSTNITGCNSATVLSGQTVRVKISVTYTFPINLWTQAISLSGYRDVVVQ